MFRKLEDFYEAWKADEEFTLQIFSKISDGKINEKPHQNIRSLGRLAWHITQTLTEMLNKAGLFEEDYLDNKPVPTTFAEISKTYKKYSDELVKLLKEKWTDEDLPNSIELYGQPFEKEKVLSMLLNHQIHHRGQMTVVMRLLNIEVPGIYGPSKEEWSKYGMEAQE
ncbi:MAG: DinB family protein [Ignavibacteria bacterium]|jgi:uncharacterized damage-inducible protein DinB